MRFCLTLLLFAVNLTLWSQFSDDFTDGDFTANPTWTGQTSNFIVNTSGELQLNAPAAADTSYLSIPTANIDNTTWDFYLRMEFNPSSSNYARIYLVSDNADLKASLNGYFVMMGGTPDEISLYRQDGLTTTKIIDGVDGSLNNDPALARVRVTRDNLGNWELLRDTTGNYSFISEGTVLDAAYTTTANFGVFCKYTATRSTLFFFDNMGDPYVDATPPSIDTVIPINFTQVDVHFSEPLNQTIAETVGSWSVNPGPTSGTFTPTLDGSDPSLVHLNFTAAFDNNTSHTLSTFGIEDLDGNPSSENKNFLFFIADSAVYNDIIITEFMADPSPPVGLPETEFVELYNRSNKYINLDGWTLSDASSAGTFGSYLLGPDEYVLVTNTGDALQFFVPNSTEISLPSLNNSDDAIVIKNQYGAIIDSIFYNLDWYHDAAKEDGGWTVERKHNDAPCNDASNWAASVNSNGGTPAEQNSVWTDQNDTSLPSVVDFTVVNETSVLIDFSEVLDTTYSLQLSVDPNINSLSWSYASLQSADITLDILQANQLYTLTISNAQDCWGNVMNSQNIQLGIPDSVEVGDVYLNEVMFNPLTGGSDYIELYNQSDKIIDLKDLMLANWDDSVANIKSISTDQKLLLPGGYALITEDSLDVINDFSVYGSGTFTEADLPTYPNDSGTVYLLSGAGIIDFFHYDEDYHFKLISDVDGKSLERILYDGGMNNPDNWRTAAEYAEWGTPGYLNSQTFAPTPQGNVSLDPTTFSPDNDGYQDVLTITIDPAGNDNVVDVEIFDNRGRLIRLLKDNYFVGDQAIITWDGVADSGEKAQIGTYIILVSILDENGNQKQYKLVAVLAGKL
ncbi:lamin tail domain-containing protein [Paracrocinitomix mangrovi]|uniref:lamin tail domain-containing protein n=1 Tax=Paracrocinitomix mangrovi TaxID=2862509 RepID=UPI001C8D2631|nr:lamin tail domain-containing protein [Paracrocinitomix mangrovi]UKN00858.1 lamin tail domain-containing protein [Paracrocinitomix mangrovi]